MNLYQQTKQLWDEKAENRAALLIQRMGSAGPEVEKVARKFREWKPLRFYLSISGASGKPVFSIRFCGQEVARLKVASKPMIHVDSKMEKTNLRDFGIVTPVLKEGIEWAGPAGQKFRKEFTRIADTITSGRGKEHACEARILQELEKKTKLTKFGGTLHNVTAVQLAGFPFQCVVPISASSGSPKATDGHIDILTRRGTGASSRLGVWELKRPDSLDHALAQAYIYTVTLGLILRSKSGPTWHSRLGYRRPIPQKLELESVVVVSESVRPRVARAAKKFIEQNPFDLDDNIHITPYAAYYDPKSLKIDFQRL
jgi:hypothetical protein